MEKDRNQKVGVPSYYFAILKILVKEISSKLKTKYYQNI